MSVDSMFANLRLSFPEASLRTFFMLQTLDAATTLIGLRLGASEGSVFISRLMRLGPIEALVIAKLFAVLLGLAAFRFGRDQLLVFLNYWFALLVSWNLCTIIYVGLTTRRL